MLPMKRILFPMAFSELAHHLGRSLSAEEFFHETINERINET